MTDFKPGEPLESQSEELQQSVEEILCGQNNVRGDMFSFTIDASEAIEVNEGEEIYGDCHLSALVHPFMDFKEFEGQLYLVKSALCIVTTAQANFDLMAELLDHNMQTMRRQRQEQLASPERAESDVYPPQVRACLLRRFERPPDDFLGLLE